MYKEKKHKILQQPPWKEFFVNILNSDKFDEDKYFDISLKYENTKDVDAVILPKTVKPTPEKLRLIRFHPLLRTESSDASITRRKSFKKSIHLQVAGKLLSRAESHKEIKGRPRSPSSLATITSISAMIVHPEYGISLTQRRNYNGSNVMAFNGKQGVEWIQRLIDTDLEQAIDIGSQLLQKGVIQSIKSIGAPDLFADAQIQIFNGEEYLWYTIPSLNPEPLVSPRRRASSPVNELCHLEPDKEFIEIGNLANLISRMQHPQSGILTKTKKSLFHEFKDCFTGDKCISWLVDNVPLSNRSEGIILANKMMKAGLIAHVLHNETIMKDKNIYYQFTATPASRTKSKE